MYADKKKSFVSIPFFNSRKKSINQGFPAASTSSAISQGTQEIQEEPELHLLSEEASANQDLPQNLEGQNSPARQVLHISDAPTTDDGALQPHPEHSVAAVLDRNSQKARTANRDRHAFLSMTKADFSWKKTTKALANVYAAAGSGLSHSAAALRNLSPYQISMASGVSWAATAACSGINHAIFSQKRDVVSLLSNAAHFGAGIASIVTTNFSYRSNPNQTNVNYAATSSNILWVAASTLEAVSALQNGRELPSEYGMSALAYTATGLGIAAGLANVASAAVSIRNTVRIRAALTP